MVLANPRVSPYAAWRVDNALEVHHTLDAVWHVDTVLEYSVDTVLC